MGEEWDDEEEIPPSTTDEEKLGEMDLANERLRREGQNLFFKRKRPSNNGK